MKNIEAKIQKAAVEQLDHIFRMRWPRYTVNLKNSKGKMERVSILYHTPNGGARGANTPEGRRLAAIAGNNLKKLGTRSGVADLTLPIANKEFRGLNIEVKEPNSGVQSDNQKEWEAVCKVTNTKYVLCESTQAIIDEVLDYMEGIK